MYMAIDDFHAPRYTPDIQRVPHTPEMPGGVPLSPDVFPELDDIETGGEGDQIDLPKKEGPDRRRLN